MVGQGVSLPRHCLRLADKMAFGSFLGASSMKPSLAFVNRISSACCWHRHCLAETLKSVPAACRLGEDRRLYVPHVFVFGSFGAFVFRVQGDRFRLAVPL
jgi:hypothetical protein